MLEEEMRSSYLDYAMSVIVGRALPDVRDGLKPVHRRILYAMHEIGLQPDAAVPQVRARRRRRDGQVPPARRRRDLRRARPPGAGLRACATRSSTARATSARSTATRRPPCGTPRRGCARLATELLRDIDEDTVDFAPNYDGSQQEPLVLPARFPNLLVNGSSGIAVGMATNIPPHNLREIIDARRRLHRQPGDRRRRA